MSHDSVMTLLVTVHILTPKLVLDKFYSMFCERDLLCLQLLLMLTAVKSVDCPMNIAHGISSYWDCNRAIDLLKTYQFCSYSACIGSTGNRTQHLHCISAIHMVRKVVQVLKGCNHNDDAMLSIDSLQAGNICTGQHFSREYGKYHCWPPADC